MFRGGFVGFGRMGITHFSILNAHPSVKIVGVCDRSKTMLKILRKYVDVATYTDYQTMMDECDLDFVVISTPTASHSEIIRAAIDRDLHIFVEKPFALTASEGQKTLAHFGNKELVNQVGYVNRFNEVFMEAKKLVEAGVIGDIKNFTSEMYGATVLKNSRGGWRGKKSMGGGCMYEFGSHCIDLVIYLIGKPDRVIGSLMQSIYSSAVEDLVSSTLIYDNGCTGTILVNWSDESYRKPTNIVKIFGTRGKILADRHSLKIYLRGADGTDGLSKGWNTRYITDFARSVRFYVRGNEFTRQLDYFVDCMTQRQTDNVSNFVEALKTDMVMDKVTSDAARSLSQETVTSIHDSHVIPKKKERPRWRRLFK